MEHIIVHSFQIQKKRSSQPKNKDKKPCAWVRDPSNGSLSKAPPLIQTGHPGRDLSVMPNDMVTQSCIHMGSNPTQTTWATSWENLFMSYANTKGADQPAVWSVPLLCAA